jgi:Tol biopolymer transport system component
MRALPCSVILLSVCGLALACGRDTTEPAAGALKLTISTTGGDLDPDGYTVTVDAGSPVVVPTNGTLSIPDLSPGQHTVTLAGLALNCVLGTPGPLEVTLSGPEGASARFEVTCSSVYTLAYQGPAGVELTDAAGTVHRTLVPEGRPFAWSPDGRLLAVSKGKAVWLASLDDGSLSPFITDTSTGGLSSGYAGFTAGTWSPNGRELLLETPQPFFSNSYPQYLVRFPLDHSYSPQSVFSAPAATGCSSGAPAGGLKGVTWPDWSPDGNQIVANACSRTYVLSPDGTSTRFLVDGRHPDWSPDGSAIVYVVGPLPPPAYGAYYGAALHLIHPDGSNHRQLTAPAVNKTDEDPAWSPDGSKVAFVRLGLAPDTSITSVQAYVVDRDGSNERQLAVLPGNSSLVHPSWSPDGLHLAYSGSPGTYVVNVDGSGFRLVSDAQASVPAQWRP